MTDLINVKIPFPEIEDFDIPTDNEEEYPNGYLQITLNTEAMQVYKRVRSELHLSRKIPLDPNAVNMGDIVFLWVRQNRPDEENPLYLVREHYKKLSTDIDGSAFILGLTYKGNDWIDDIPVEPVEVNTTKEEVPSWLSAVPELPEPTPNLKNPFEKRYSSFNHVVSKAGTPFAIKLNQYLSKAMQEAIKVTDSDVDEDGFPPNTSSGEVLDGDDAVSEEKVSKRKR